MPPAVVVRWLCVSRRVDTAGAAVSICGESRFVAEARRASDCASIWADPASSRLLLSDEILVLMTIPDSFRGLPFAGAWLNGIPAVDRI